MAPRQQFHLSWHSGLWVHGFPGCARAHLRERARHIAFTRHGGAAALERALDHHAGDTGAAQAADAAHRHQSHGALTRASAGRFWIIWGWGGWRGTPKPPRGWPFLVISRLPPPPPA